MSNNSSSFGFQSGAPSAPSAPSTPSVPGQGVSQFGQGMSNFGNTLNQNGANPIGNWFGQMGNNISNFGQGIQQIPDRLGNLRNMLTNGGSGWINAFGHRRNPNNPTATANPATNPVSTTPVASTVVQAPVVTPETSDMQGSPIYQAWLNAKQYNNNFNGFNDKYQQLQQMLTQNNPNWTQAEIDRNTINGLGGYLLNGQY